LERFVRWRWHSKGDSADQYKAAWATHEEVADLLEKRSDEIDSGRFDHSPHALDLKRNRARRLM